MESRLSSFASFSIDISNVCHRRGFPQLRSGRKALMPFLTAGDPDLDFTASRSPSWPPGAQPVRVGHPLQRSDRRRAGDPGLLHPALENGVRSSAGHLRHARAASVGLTPPVVTMVSYAIIYRHGLESYVNRGAGGGRGGGDRARPARRGGRPRWPTSAAARISASSS